MDVHLKDQAGIVPPSKEEIASSRASESRAKLRKKTKRAVATKVQNSSVNNEQPIEDEVYMDVLLKFGIQI